MDSIEVKKYDLACSRKKKIEKNSHDLHNGGKNDPQIVGFLSSIRPFFD